MGAGTTSAGAVERRRSLGRVTSSRIVVRDMLSCQSAVPVAAGAPRYEGLELWLGRANWHGGFSCATPPRPQRGTSPSPRVVFDRTTFPPPLWIPAFAGMTKSVAGAYPGSWSGTCFHSNRRCRQGPVHEGIKSWSCGMVGRIGTAGFCHAPPPPQRGTSPSPRLVFDRTTFFPLHPLASAPFTIWTDIIVGAIRHNGRKEGGFVPRPTRSR